MKVNGRRSQPKISVQAQFSNAVLRSIRPTMLHRLTAEFIGTFWLVPYLFGGSEELADQPVRDDALEDAPTTT
jgi:hypothetical protein